MTSNDPYAVYLNRLVNPHWCPVQPSRYFHKEAPFAVPSTIAAPGFFNLVWLSFGWRLPSDPLPGCPDRVNQQYRSRCLWVAMCAPDFKLGGKELIRQAAMHSLRDFRLLLLEHLRDTDGWDMRGAIWRKSDLIQQLLGD